MSRLPIKNSMPSKVISMIAINSDITQDEVMSEFPNYQQYQDTLDRWHITVTNGKFIMHNWLRIAMGGKVYKGDIVQPARIDKLNVPAFVMSLPAAMRGYRDIPSRQI